MTESDRERPPHNPDDARGGGGVGGGPGTDAQKIWQANEERKRTEKERAAESGTTSEPSSDRDE